MKKIFLITIMFFATISLDAQITIRENKIVEKPLLRPQPFDSLSNIRKQNRPIDHKKYIGYKLFFIPESKSYDLKRNDPRNLKLINYLYSDTSTKFSNSTKKVINGGVIKEKVANLDVKNVSLSSVGGLFKKKKKRKEKEVITNVYKPKFYSAGVYGDDSVGSYATIPDSVCGKYFTILDITAKEGTGRDKVYEKLEDIDTNIEPRNLYLNIKLRNDSNNEILYWRPLYSSHIQNSPFVLIPYFEKLKKTYLNQDLRLKEQYANMSNFKNLIDVNTGEVVDIKPNELWTCSDISFVDSKDSYYLKPFYFLRKDDKEIKLSLEYGAVENHMMLETEYKRLQSEQQKNEELREKELLAEKAKREEQRKYYKAKCIARWGQKMGSLVADGKVVLGMTKKMCNESWGTPIDVNTTIVRGITSEQWVYSLGTYLYFENGKLTAIQN